MGERGSGYEGNQVLNMRAKHKILIVFGTRPEALKLAPVIAAFRRDSRFLVWTCLTGQHREMVDQVLHLFKIRTDFDLNLMVEAQTLGDLTSKLFPKIDSVLKKIRPDLLILQGDTTTAFAVTLDAFYNRIPIAHVEAGLRTYNKYHPFPEEINRKLISHVADLHFAPTQGAKKNLLCEGISAKNIFVTGNTIVDALKQVRLKLSNSDFRRQRKRAILVTAHRRESFGKPLINICCALKTIAKEHPDIEIIYPVHLNPNVRSVVYRELSGIRNIRLLKPVNYIEFLKLMAKCHFILTDSGGIQEEAPSFGKPVLIMRDVSERGEGIRMGISKIVGTSTSKIVREATRLLNHPSAYRKMVGKKNPYGDGMTSNRIVQISEKFLRL